MRYRWQATSKVAFWMLVALADVAIFLAEAGTVALIALASVVTVAVAAAGVWLLLRPTMPDRRPARSSAAVLLANRRRA